MTSLHWIRALAINTHITHWLFIVLDRFQVKFTLVINNNRKINWNFQNLTQMFKGKISTGNRHDTMTQTAMSRWIWGYSLIYFSKLLQHIRRKHPSNYMLQKHHLHILYIDVINIIWQIQKINIEFWAKMFDSWWLFTCYGSLFCIFME